MSITIIGHHGRIEARSKNLRGIMDYSRKQAVERVDLYHTGIRLKVTWTNSATCNTTFADMTVLRQWADRFCKYRNVPLQEHR